MSTPREPRHRDRVQRQAQRQAAVQALARERVLREALEVFDPQPEDVHLDYGALLDRLQTVLARERGWTAE